jgi:hypothetical protein
MLSSSYVSLWWSRRHSLIWSRYCPSALLVCCHLDCNLILPTKITSVPESGIWYKVLYYGLSVLLISDYFIQFRHHNYVLFFVVVASCLHPFLKGCKISSEKIQKIQKNCLSSAYNRLDFFESAWRSNQYTYKPIQHAGLLIPEIETTFFSLYIHTQNPLPPCTGHTPTRPTPNQKYSSFQKTETITCANSHIALSEKKKRCSANFLLETFWRKYVCSEKYSHESVC